MKNVLFGLAVGVVVGYVTSQEWKIKDSSNVWRTNSTVLQIRQRKK